MYPIQIWNGQGGRNEHREIQLASITYTQEIWDRAGDGNELRMS